MDVRIAAISVGILGFQPQAVTVQVPGLVVTHALKSSRWAGVVLDAHATIGDAGTLIGRVLHTNAPAWRDVDVAVRRERTTIAPVAAAPRRQSLGSVYIHPQNI